MEEEKVLELRMYFLTIYQLSGIQIGIQAGHAALEYARRFKNSETFIDFIDNHKTWIILNGGTTNDQRDFKGIAQGTLNQIGDELYENGIDFSYFREPDLNDALTALCFICDERVFNRKDYPDFKNYLFDKMDVDSESYTSIKLLSDDELIEQYPDLYKEWVRLLGGVKNVYLRNLIRDKKLA